MPPFADHFLPTMGLSSRKPESNNIITLNVGGRIFQTTPQTLDLAGPKSLLSTLNCPSQGQVPFIDRDPELFSILLAFLRTGNLPSRAKKFDLEDIIAEAQFYNLHRILISSISNASEFDPLNLDKTLILPLNGRDFPSAISCNADGSILVAHGSKITSFDWSFCRKSTILTQFSAVDSLLALSPDLAAAGATDFSGLQILDLNSGVIRETLNWNNQSIPNSSSTVQAIGSSPDSLIASFESGRRNASSVVIFDRGTFQPVAEIGRREIYGAELDSAIPATKLQWVSAYKLLLASGSHSSPSGLLGNIRLWDVNSGNVAWELQERTDCFSDITVSENLSAIFKVGVNSGEVFMADLRKLGAGNPWISLGESRGGTGKKEGANCRIASHGNQIFCSRNGDVELWSEILMGSVKSSENLLENRVFKRNLMGTLKNLGGNRITQLGFGGNKMVLTRKDQQIVEVWQNSGSDFLTWGCRNFR